MSPTSPIPKSELKEIEGISKSLDAIISKNDERKGRADELSKLLFMIQECMLFVLDFRWWSKHDKGRLIHAVSAAVGEIGRKVVSLESER